MKTFFILPIFLFFHSIAIGQNLYDKYWVLGLAPEQMQAPHGLDGGYLIDFTKNPIEQIPFNLSLVFENYRTAINNKYGVPQFYSAGCQVRNFKGSNVVGGDSINFGGFGWEDACSNGNTAYYGSNWGIMTLPDPASDDKYYMFHHWYDGLSGSNPDALFLTKIDMSKYDGRGEVVFKNENLLQDSLSDGMTAVRHGNGRDYWLLVNSIGSDAVNLFLVGKSGVKGPFKKTNLGYWFGWDDSRLLTTCKFSPDGKKFIRMDDRNGIQIADFDRCTGEFYNPIRFDFTRFTVLGIDYFKDFQGDWNVPRWCACWSPNSRFLYITTILRIFQFDTWATDIAKSWIIVGEYDGFQDVGYFQPEIAPNNKIYISTGVGGHYLSVIHNPDEKGLACNFEPHGLNMMTNNSHTLCQYPNFRLLDWANSPCDSIGINGVDSLQKTDYNGHLFLFPNPTNEEFQANIPFAAEPILKVFAVTGQLIFETYALKPSESLIIDAKSWAAGVYLVSFFDGKHLVETKKMVVLR